MKKKPIKIAWSTDEEYFNFDSKEEAIDFIFDEDNLENLEGRPIYFGEVVPQLSSRFTPDADDILETMSERAWDECGEFAEDWPSCVSSEEKKKLQNYIDRWAKKNCPVHFFTVTNVKEYKITSEDVEQAVKAQEERKRIYEEFREKNKEILL